MATIAGYKNSFNNLLYHRDLNVEKERAVRIGARIPLDLSYKGQSPVDKILNSGAAQLNGKYGDSKYLPDTEKHSRPYYGYDARIDTTILDAVRAKYVDVSGLLIPNYQLRKKYDINTTQHPFKKYSTIY